MKSAIHRKTASAFLHFTLIVLMAEMCVLADNSKHATIARATRKISIDGVLDEPDWVKAEPIGEITRRERLDIRPYFAPKWTQDGATGNNTLTGKFGGEIFYNITFHRSEAAGLNLVIRGSAELLKDDRKLIGQSIPIFDGLYELLGRNQEKSKGGEDGRKRTKNRAAKRSRRATVTTYATFLPCFFFIFLGAPYIEVLRGNKDLAGALSGITAAIVGVVLNLALVFGAAVVWPQGLAGGTNWFAVVMSIAAFAALYRFKTDVLWVVLGGGLIGLARALLSG